MCNRSTRAAISVALAAVLAAQLGVAPATLALEPEREYLQTPESGKIVYENVRFQTGDGVELSGWFLPFQDQEGNDFRNAAPIIILVPPPDVNMGDLLWHYSVFFRGTPWHCLLFDWRGYGESDAWPIDRKLLIIPEFIHDLNAAIDYAKARPEWDGEHLGIFAFFVGGAVAMAAATERTDISCMVLRSIYTSQQSFLENWNELDEEDELVVNADYPDAMEPYQTAKRLDTPVYFIVGEQDSLTTIEMAEELYNTVIGKRQLWIAKESGHTGMEIPEVVKLPEFAAKVHSFYRRHVGTAGY